MTDLIRSYVKLLLESSPSKFAVRSPSLSADSTGFEQSHLNFVQYEPEEEEIIAPHLLWAEEQEETDIPDEEFHGPVPPQKETLHVYPDPYVRGQYDNVTWQR